MFYVVVGLIVVVAAVVVLGSVMRKKIYNQIDRYESWKIDIMNRPVTEEISKVKELKMIGETEKKFEIWRHDWDEIITTELPLVEERLFDAEELADKLRFQKAQRVLNDIEKNMGTIESRIKEMLVDLNKVVDSEEQNRKDIVAVKEAFHSLKKELITKRPNYKNAAPYVEAQLGQIENDLTHYENEAEEGNVIKAREVLMRSKKQLDGLSEKMEIIPKQYKDIHTVVPNQLKELEQGVAQMIDEGYVLDHLKISEQMVEIRKHLQVYESGMEKAEFADVTEGLNHTFEQLDWIYNQLEKEAESRKQLQEDAGTLKHDLHLVGKKIKEISHETEIVKQSYHIDKEDLKAQSDIDEAFEKLDKEHKEVDEVISEKKQAFSIVFEKVEDMSLHLEQLRKSANDFKEKLTDLRKDELVAKESLHNLKYKLLESRRKVQKSNLPGVPMSYITVLEDGEEILLEIDEKLDKKPLEMHTVQQLLEEAQGKIDLLYEKTDELVESAILTEQLIQYGNRYRSRNPVVHEELIKAEAYFRSFNYSEAVEIAAAAIHQVDADVLKKFKVEIEEIS